MEGYTGPALSVGEDWRIVLLSFLVAALASFTALELTGPAAAARRPALGLAWLFAGTTALATGMWAMHFVGMQAMRIGIPIGYDIPLVVVSFFIALAGTTVSLWLVIRGKATRGVVAASSVLLGLCLAGMHYTGMTALRMAARVQYDPTWVAISVAIAIVTSYAVFRLIARFTAEQRQRQPGPMTLTASVLGLAIISVHYAGMAGARFYPSPAPFDGVAVDQQSVAVVVAAATIAVFAVFLAAALISRRTRERRRDEERYRMLAESVPNLMWTATTDGSVDYCNGRFAEYTGEPRESLAARGWYEFVHEADRAQASTVWQTAIAAGAPYRAEARLRRSDGTFRWHVMLAVPMREDDGAIVKWFGSCTDIQDQKDAARILTVLADVTQALASSLDPIEIARTLTAVVVPAEAAYCEVRLYDENGVLAPVATAGDATLYGSDDAERAERVRRAGATLLTRRLSVVPVRVSEALLGWLVCCDVVDDVRALVPELALRLGGAIANANAYEREHRVATTFQRAALGPDLPDVPGLHFSALYQAAQAEASVGGDWYDGFRLPDGRVVISVGDVAGSGLDAAVTMGSVRQSIRTAVLINPNPVAVLEAVDRIVRAMGHDRFVTAFVGVLDPAVGELVYANAGHPPPLLRFPDHHVVELAQHDLPLGLRQRGPVKPAIVSIDPGSVILAFTDGLTEFDRDPISGHAKVARALGTCRRADVARAIFEAVSRGKPARDDIAILAVAFDAVLTEVDDPNRASRWSFDIAEGRRAAQARQEYLERLRDVGFSKAELAAAELVFGELIGNVYRYAGGRVEIMLDTSGAAAVLHVLDDGHGFELRPRLPANPLAERGRGLFLVNAFSDEFSMERRRTGGSHARAVLVGTTRKRVAATMARTAL